MVGKWSWTTSSPNAATKTCNRLPPRWSSSCRWASGEYSVCQKDKQNNFDTKRTHKTKQKQDVVQLPLVAKAGCLWRNQSLLVVMTKNNDKLVLVNISPSYCSGTLHVDIIVIDVDVDSIVILFRYTKWWAGKLKDGRKPVIDQFRPRHSRWLVKS